MSILNTSYYHATPHGHHRGQRLSNSGNSSHMHFSNRRTSSGLSGSSSRRSLVGSIRDKMSFNKRPAVSPFEDPSHSIISPVSPIAPSTNPFAHTAPPTRRPQFAALPPSSSELPPAYVEPIVESPDDPYAFLSKFDTVFLIDDSGSMAGRSWRETAAALATIAPICTSRDHDGIDIHFLNHPRSFTNLTSAAAVQSVFEQVRPRGGTPTGCRLRALFTPYVARVEAQAKAAASAASTSNNVPVDEVKPMNLIVITDGAASDDVESEIKRIANRLEAVDAPAWQVGIQFFQVGREPGAAEALQELDDELVHQGCRRDIVDTVPWKGGINGTACELSADKILKCVLGAVVRKIDRKRNSVESVSRNIHEIGDGKR